MATCRFCRGGDDDDLVKYGVRHYAHGRCLFVNRRNELDRKAGVLAILNALPIAALNDFRPLMDFDDESQVGTMAEVGMTGLEFMAYIGKRGRKGS